MMIVFLFTVLLVLLLILYFSAETDEDVHASIRTRTLDRDGFKVLTNPDFDGSSSEIGGPLFEQALNQLPPGYLFMDYIYEIYDSSLFTFHRDVTSSKHVFKTKHPVYTFIVYISDGCLISVCPGSHSSYPFVWSRIVNIQGNKGTAFLFDSDLLHAGCVNGCSSRKVLQYKVCHRDDIPLLQSLQGVRMTKKEVCTDTPRNRLVRKLSYFFEFPINYVFTPFMIKKYPSDSFMGQLQSMIPIKFYNNA
jgi:hypothetical protein